MPDSLRKSASLPTVIEHEPGWILSSCVPTMMQVLQRQKHTPVAPCEQQGRGETGLKGCTDRGLQGKVGGVGWKQAQHGGAHLLDVDLRVLLTTHEHVLDARDRRARRGEARGRSKVRRDGGDLGNLGLLRGGEGRMS